MPSGHSGEAASDPKVGLEASAGRGSGLCADRKAKTQPGGKRSAAIVFFRMRIGIKKQSDRADKNRGL